MDALLDKNFISTREASELSGYNPDYISRLCRTNAIVGSRVGRNWFVQKDSLLAFVETQEQQKKEYAEALAAQREAEYQAAEALREAPVSPVVTEPEPTFIEAVQAQRSVPSPFMERTVALAIALLTLAGSVTLAAVDAREILVRGSEKTLSLLNQDGLLVDSSLAYASVGYGFLGFSERYMYEYAELINSSGENGYGIGIALRDALNQILLGGVELEIAAGSTLSDLAASILNLHDEGVVAWTETAQEIPALAFHSTHELGEFLASGTAYTSRAIAHGSISNASSVYALLDGHTLGIIGNVARTYENGSEMLAAVASVRIVPESYVIEDTHSLAAATNLGLVDTVGEYVALPTYENIQSWFKNMGGAIARLFLTRIAEAPILPQGTSSNAVVISGSDEATSSYSIVDRRQTIENITNQFFYTGITAEYLDERVGYLLGRQKEVDADVVSGGGSGSVTSVDISGGTTGFSFTGGPITSTGAFTLSGTLDIDNGGTGLASAPTYGQLMVGDGAGGYTLVATSSLNIIGAASSPGGADTYVQFNNAGVFAGDSGFTYNATADRVTTTYASTTAFSSGYASSTNAFFGNLSVGSLSGVLKATGGVVSIATGGTDYENPLSFSYPLQRSANTISLAFATSSSNVWGGTQTFTNTPVLGTLSGLVGSNNGTLYQIATSTSFVTSLTAGTGISLSGNTGAITVSATGGGGSGTVATSTVESAGQVPFWTSTAGTPATLGSDSSFFWDNATKRLGLGTSSPFARLAVVGQTVAEYFTATSTSATSTFPLAQITSALTFGSDYLTDLTGTGLQITGNALTINATGDWTGTLDGQEGSFYLSRANHTGSQTASTISDFDTAVNSYIHSSTTIPKTYSANTFTAAQVFSGGLTFGSLTGPLQAVNGVVSATSTLSQVFGGTGYSSYTSGDILYANSSGVLTKLGIGSAGQVLKVTGGLPVWGVDQTSGGGGGAGAWSTTTDDLAIYPADTSDVVIVGNNATTTANSILEVFGRTYISQSLGIATTAPGATLSVAGSGLFNGMLTAFGNITGPIFTATSTSATSTFPLAQITSALTFGSDYLTDLTGTGLQITGNALTINATGDWTGTLDGQEGSFYLSRANHTGSQTASTISDFDTAVNSYIHSSTTIPKTYSANTFTAAQVFSGGLTLGTLNGPLQANNGLISATTSIGVLYGGTGLTSAPSYGQVLVGNSSGGYTLMATSSLGITGGGSIGSGTIGQFPYYADNGTALTATSSLFISTTGNIAIGTSSPAVKLVAAGSIFLEGLSNYINFGTTTGSSGYGFRDNSGTLEFKNINGGWNNVAIATTGPSFSVHKNGTNQTVSADTITLLTWNTEVFDTNNNFASNRFTPTVPGKYLVNANVYCSNSTSSCYIYIYKNGTGLTISGVASAGTGVPNTSVVVDMNGTTDYLEAYVYNGGGTTVAGNSIYTYFTGTMIAPVRSDNVAGWTNDGISSYLLDNADFLGIGTSTPWGRLSINPIVNDGAAPAFVVGSSSATSFVITNGGRVGAGTTTPGATFSVQGNGLFSGNLSVANLTATGTAAITGLATFGSGVNVNSETITDLTGTGLQNSAGALTLNATGDWTGTLDSLEAASFLRSDASDSYTSGTLTFDAGTLLDLNTTGLSIADTDVAFDGASTNFTFTGNFTANTDDLVVIKSTGNVGIGTTSPTGRLDVYGAIDTPLIYMSTHNGNRLIAGTHSDSDGYLRLLDSSGNTDVYLQADRDSYLNVGNIGIGTTSPSRKLTISDASASQIVLTDASVSSDAWNFRSINGSLYFATSSATTFATSSVPALTINTNGYVGVGTSTPGSLFAINGVANFLGGGTSATSSIYSNLALSGRLLLDNSQDIFWKGSGGTATSILELSGDTTFLRGGGGTPTLRIDNSTGTNLMTFLETGSVGIGTTSPGTLLSLGDTGNNTINISAVATSTFGSGINLRTGCYAINGVCVGSGSLSGSGSSGRVAYWNGASSLTSDSGFTFDGTTLTAPVLVASSASATSTFAGGLTIEGTGFMYEAATNNVSIGISPTTIGSPRLGVYEAPADTTGTILGINALLQNINTSESTANYYAVQAQAMHHANATAGVGVGGSINAIRALIAQGDTSTIDIIRGLDVSLSQNAGTLTNTYGIYLGDFSSGTQTNMPFSLYSSDANTYNYFAGRVGIGTTSPESLLNIVGADPVLLVKDTDTSISTADSRLRLAESGAGGITDNYWDIGGYNSGGNFAFNIYDSTSASNAFVISRQTNLVGIGTTTPYAKLSVVGQVVAANYTATTTAVNTFPYASTTAITSSGYASFAATSGNVGIGTVSPVNYGAGYKTLAIDGSTTGLIDWLSGGIRYGTAYNSGINFLIGNADAGDLQLMTNATPRVYIDSNGDVGVADATPDFPLEVVGQFAISATESGDGDRFLVNGSGLVGIGTTTPRAGQLTIASTTGPQLSLSDGSNSSAPWNLRSINGNFYLATSSPSTFATSSTAAFTVSSIGNVGIGTSTPVSTLDIFSNINALGATTTAQLLLEGNSNNVGLQLANYQSGGRTWGLSSSGGSAGSAPSSFRIYDFNAGIDRFAISSTGNVGVGTTTPYRKFSVTDAVSTAQVAVSYDTDRYTTFLTDSVGDLTIDAQGADIRANDENLWICAAGACPSGTPAGTGNLIVETALGVGTSTPSQQLAVAANLFVGNSGATGLGQATSTFQGDIRILGKLDVSTIDPVYQIAGVKYATYGHSTVGVKEEVVETIQVAAFDEASGKYIHTISFSDLKQGSDLWLFYQITDLGSNWENLVVSLTPGFDGAVSYEKDAESGKLLIRADQSGEVSLRLIANRHDSDKWPNLRPDQDDDFFHFLLPKKP